MTRNVKTVLPDRSETTHEPFGLVGWLEQTRVVLPLKGVECRFNVCGELLHVELDQIFHQNATRPMDCLYTFPLPYGAAVYRCELHVNGRCVRAKVEEVEEARRLVKEHKAAGHRTALVEMERENLFTLSLGNLQPNDVVVVRFAYFQMLNRLQDWTSFHIPVCPGIRYIPGRPLLRSPRGRGVEDDTDQVPDASRISPPRIDALDPEAAYFIVEGTVQDPLNRLQDLSSPSHPVLVRDGEHAKQVCLADNGAVPDRDFVLRWTEQPSPETAAVGWVCQSGDRSHALIRLVGPADTSAQEADGQDVYFLVDRSGSMGGIKWQQAARGFVEFLKVLGPKDRVWATFFESSYQDLAEKPLSAAELLNDPSVQSIERIGTAGGTELLPALRHVLEKVRVHSQGRSACLVLITDGQVGNEAEILAEMQRHPDLRVHTLGVDTVVNDALLKQLAARHHGQCHLLTPHDDIVGTVARLGGTLARPVLTRLKVEAPWQPANGSLPVLYANGVVAVPLEGPTDVTTVTVRGQRPDGSTWTTQVQLRPTAEPALRLLWARQRIEHLQDQGRQPEALQLAKSANLICQGAAFVAWDDAEQVIVSAEGDEVYQPALMPHGWEVPELLAMLRFSPPTPREFQDLHVFYCLDRLTFSESSFSHVGTVPIDLCEAIRQGDYRQRPVPARWVQALRDLQAQARRHISLERVEVDEVLSEWWRAMMGFGLPPAVDEAWWEFLVGLGSWVREEPNKTAQRLLQLMVLLQQLSEPNLDPVTWLRRLETWLRRNARPASPQGSRLQALLQEFSRHYLSHVQSAPAPRPQP